MWPFLNRRRDFEFWPKTKLSCIQCTVPLLQGNSAGVTEIQKFLKEIPQKLRRNPKTKFASYNNKQSSGGIGEINLQLRFAFTCTVTVGSSINLFNQILAKLKEIELWNLKYNERHVSCSGMLCNIFLLNANEDENLQIGKTISLFIQRV